MVEGGSLRADNYHTTKTCQGICFHFKNYADHAFNVISEHRTLPLIMGGSSACNLIPLTINGSRCPTAPNCISTFLPLGFWSPSLRSGWRLLACSSTSRSRWSRRTCGLSSAVGFLTSRTGCDAWKKYQRRKNCERFGSDYLSSGNLSRRESPTWSPSTSGRSSSLSLAGGTANNRWCGMARYIARTCPKCRDYFGVLVSQWPTESGEHHVSAFCATCGYRLLGWRVILGRKSLTAVYRTKKPSVFS